MANQFIELMTNEEALRIAYKVIEMIRPACQKISTTGEVYRGDEKVLIVEVLAVPVERMFDGDNYLSFEISNRLKDGDLVHAGGNVYKLPGNDQLIKIHTCKLADFDAILAAIDAKILHNGN